jgi:hypothetical protein
MQLAEHAGFTGSFKPHQTPVSADDADADADAEADPADFISDLQRKQAIYILDNVKLPQEFPDTLRDKLYSTLAVCPLGPFCPTRAAATPGEPDRGHGSCSHTFPTEFHVTLTHCPDPKCGISFVFSRLLSEFPAEAPNLKERLKTDTATLYTGQFEIIGIRVFHAKCKGCGVTYLPDPSATEGLLVRMP